MASANQPTDSKAREKALTFLRRLQGQAGSFAYKSSGQPSMEATAWAALALREDKTVAEAAATYLVQHQNKDGGWSTEPGAGRSDWNSGPALLCLRLLSLQHQTLAERADVKKAIKIGFSRLLDSRTEFYRPIGRLMLLISKGPEALTYARGWPWDPDCFHWVEPTSYNLLALKFPALPTDELYEHIVNFADKFLLEHSCLGGGWNHGNDVSLGAELPPYRLTTAEALLALQDQNEKTVVKSGLKYLQSLSQQNTSSISLALSALALAAYDLPTKQELNFLISRQTDDGSFNNLVVPTAMAALALEINDGKNLLKHKKV